MFDNLFDGFSWNFGGKHTYSLSGVGTPKKVDRVFSSRENAMKEMYRLCNRYGMYIVKVYDDNHDKSYFTNTGAEFHINRLY